MAWQLDPTHSEVGFSVRHMMVSKVRGRFRDFEATVELDEERPERSRVEARIDAASVDTGWPDRDADLRSANFFDVEHHAQLVFRSTRVVPKGDGEFRVIGDLTIRGVTHEVELTGEFSGPAGDPWGNRRAGFSLRGEIDREAWGLTWNQVLEAGGLAVGKKVQLQVEVEVLAPAAVAVLAA